MSLLRDMGLKLEVAGELLLFLWQRKLWWMIPLVFVLLVLGLLIVFGTSSGAGPFIYALF